MRSTESEGGDFAHGLRDLDHDPALAAALGNMVVAWAHAETVLLGTLARVSGSRLNMIQAGYYRIPTFEARVKFLQGLITEWNTEKFDKSVISAAIDKLSKLASTRNHWIHGDWCLIVHTKETVIYDQRAALGSPRCKPVKAADVASHCEAVIRRASDLNSLIDWDSLPL
jgi:hypothetical protein